MRVLLSRKGLVGLILVLGLSAAALTWWTTRSTDLLLENLEQRASAALAAEVSIGALRWQFWPAPELRAEQLLVDRDGWQYAVANIRITANWFAPWQNLDYWQLDHVTLEGITADRGDLRATVAGIHLSEINLQRAAKLAAQDIIVWPTPDSTPWQGSISTHIRRLEGSAEESQERGIELSGLNITSDQLTGQCQVSMRETPPTASQSDIGWLPVHILQKHAGFGDCQLQQLVWNDTSLGATELSFTLVNGSLDIETQGAEFLGGQQSSNLQVEFAETPIRWQAVAEFTQLDTQALQRLTNRDVTWNSQLNGTLEATFQGNDRTSFSQTLASDLTFETGPGSVDVRRLKAQLAKEKVALQLAGTAQWPDDLAYQAMRGTLKSRGIVQTLDVRADNLHLTADGTTDYLSEQMDLRADVTVASTEAPAPISVNDMLLDTPIPLRCRGTFSEPSCKLDSDGVQQLLARALRSGDDSGLRRTLEEKIEEKVPEEYRDAARGLLDLLGRALGDN